MTPKEQEVMLLLFKNFSSHYNANTLSKKIGLSRPGALKIVKSLKKQGLVVSKQYGKAIFYKVNLESDYNKQIVKTLLMGEAREKGRRWLHEFKAFFEHLEMAVLFGSAVRDYSKANDVDIILVLAQKKIKVVQELINDKNRILVKPIHPLWQSPNDIVKNLALPDPVIVNALRFGYVLHGYDLLIDAVHKAQKAHGIFAVPEPERRL